MKKIISDILVSFWEKKLPNIIPRESLISLTSKPIKKAITLIGPRRSGKTSTCFYKIIDLVNKGLDKKKILYINFEDERLIDFKVSDFDTLIKTYFELSGYSTQDNQIYFFFDEIQNIDFWEKFITRLINDFNISIWITGSSAKMLSHEINTSLRGKNIVSEILPLNFSGYLNFNSIKFDSNFIFSIDETNRYKKAFKDFLIFGAFPEIVLEKNNETKLNITQNYYDLIFYRDIVDRYNIRDIASLKKFRKIITYNFTNKISLKKVSTELKIGYQTVTNWLEYFCDSYYGFILKKFNFSALEVEKSISKFYLVDNCFFSNNFLDINPYNLSSLLENQVFLEIRKLGLSNYENIFYFEEDGKEIDFIIFYKGKITCIQVSYEISNKKTYNREVRSLEYVKQKYGVDDLILVIGDEVRSFEENGISFLSFYDFVNIIKNKFKDLHV